MQHLSELFTKYPELEAIQLDIQRAFEAMRDAYRGGGKLLFCGNGGSAADCEHLVGELMKGYLSPRPVPETERQELLRRFPEEGAYLADHLQGALPAISLVSQVGFITGLCE
jgi:D-sedoheptulose 7-phosphate isomerase